MNKQIRILILIMMFLLSFTSCSGSMGGDGSNGGTDNSHSLAQNKGERQEQTLTVLIMRSDETKVGSWQGWGAKKLYDDLKLRLNFFLTGASHEVELRQYLMAGQLPDFLGLKSLDHVKLIMDADMLLPLDEYRDKLPSLFENPAYLNAIRYTMDHNSNGTGKLYVMPVSIGPSNYHSFNWVPLLQWAAYKKVGMPRIRTLEDYLDVVEQMTEYKPETEKGDKVYGFSLFSEWDELSALEISTLSFMYGIDSRSVSPLMEVNVINGEINSLLDENSFYKRALHFYFEANQRGLLDPDSMSQNYEDIVDKFSEGRILFSWFSWLYGSYNSEENQNNPEKVDGMASVVAEDMKLYKAPNQTIGRQWYFAISRNCSDVDAALELMNWLYDPQVQRYLTSGPQGVTWDYNEKGEPEIINWELVDHPSDPIMPESVGGGSFKDGMDYLEALGLEAETVLEDGYSLSYRYWPSTLDRNPTLMKQEVSEMLGGVSLAEYLYGHDMVAESTQAVNMVSLKDPVMERNILQIGEVVKKISWQMVYARNEEEFEELWRNMADQARALGLDEITSYYAEEWFRALKLVEEYE